MKLINKISNGIEWFNGFSFRLFTVIFGSIAVVIISAIFLIFVSISSVAWILIGKEHNMKELSASED